MDAALEASIAAHGRSIPIYHEIHHESEQEKASVQCAFLSHLKGIIPSHLDDSSLYYMAYNDTIIP